MNQSIRTLLAGGLLGLALSVTTAARADLVHQYMADVEAMHQRARDGYTACFKHLGVDPMPCVESVNTNARLEELEINQRYGLR
jgi:hypothetical protein